MLSATLLCAAATSSLAAYAQTTTPQPPSPVVIDQVQLGDVTADQQLHVTAQPTGVSQTTTAVGNSGLGTAEESALDYRATQRVGGNVVAHTSIATDDGAGQALDVTTSATGNTGTAGTCCAALTGASSQTIDAGKTVTAITALQVVGPSSTGSVSADSSAIGNTLGWETKGGSVNAASIQTNHAETYAGTGGVVGMVNWTGSYSATAVANNVTSDATDAPVTLQVSQSADGLRTRGGINLTGDGAQDVVAASTAASNNITVTADGHAVALTSDQTNAAPVQAETELTLGGWNNGATASSYGVANSAIVSNSGPSTTVSGTQSNTAEVSAVSGFTGNGAGYSGDAAVFATAAGNAYSAYACAECNGVATGTVRQTNSGGVSATTNVTTPSQGYVTGAASAVGNTATFQVKKN